MIGIGILALGEKVRGVWIGPAIMVPIVNMLAEHDQLGASDWLPAFQLLQQRIRRRTTRTSLRRKQLYKYPRRRSRSGDVGCSRKGACGQKNRDRERPHEML